MMMKKALRVPILWVLPWFLAPALLASLFWPWTPDSEATRSQDAPRSVPAGLIRWPENNSRYAIFVDKSEQKVLVYRTDDLTAPVKTYRCSTGENDGPKTRKNDKKTPEGIYFFTGVFEERDLTPIYGPMAFPVDYPNPLDRKEGKDGYGIWFHGTNRKLKPKDTNGCIALENGNIDALLQYIALYDTPTIISSRLEMVDPVVLERERLALELLIEGWRNAWENKRIDEYMSFYSDDFFSSSTERKAWQEHKAGLARKYDQIRVGIDNLRILRQNGIVLAKFDQHYQSDMFDSRGEKRLYLHKNSDEWKILGEYFVAEKERVRVAGKTQPKPKPEPKPDPSKPIRDLIGRWEQAWEGRDTDAYIACYDRSFRSRGMDRERWKLHRDWLNRKHQTVELQFGDPEIRFLGGGRAKATFTQDYRADDYTDYGLKELLLIKRGGTWRITREEWRELERKTS